MVDAVDFPFLFWRCVSLFGVDPDRIMRMGLRMFWSMVRHCDRIEASRELRNLNCLVAAAGLQAGSAEYLKQLQQDLVRQIGTVTKEKEIVSDREDLHKFLALAGNQGASSQS